MGTTIRLPEDLLRPAKAHAASTGRTLTGVIEDALRRELDVTERRASDPFRAHTVGGNGLYPGVDLDDSAALHDRMGLRP